MHESPRRTDPPFCPNPRCRFHLAAEGWHWKRDGFHLRQCPPWRVQRYRCRHCGRSFSDQTFSTTYWLKRPNFLVPLFWRLLGCSAFRQIAREFGCAPSTVAGQSSRLGRHALLFQSRYGTPARLEEPLVLDGFESFEWSQYHPTWFHLAIGAESHFLYGFTDSELRRKGRMTARQKLKRAWLEAHLGRPNPRAIEQDTLELLRQLPPSAGKVTVHSDEHRAYPRALRQWGRALEHQTTPGRRSRTPANPLFPVNLADLLIRHSGANHKRETIAFSKRRQSAAERLAVFQVWRNFIKPLSERRKSPTPAMRVGLATKALSPAHILARRLLPSRIALSKRARSYYWKEVLTRALPVSRRHRLEYAA